MPSSLSSSSRMVEIIHVVLSHTRRETRKYTKTKTLVLHNRPCVRNAGFAFFSSNRDRTPIITTVSFFFRFQHTSISVRPLYERCARIVVITLVLFARSFCSNRTLLHVFRRRVIMTSRKIVIYFRKKNACLIDALVNVTTPLLVR